MQQVPSSNPTQETDLSYLPIFVFQIFSLKDWEDELMNEWCLSLQSLRNTTLQSTLIFTPDVKFIYLYFSGQVYIPLYVILLAQQQLLRIWTSLSSAGIDRELCIFPLT